MSDLLAVLLQMVAAVGCGTIGGAFFAFSTFVMAALARLPPDQGIAAMQSINRVVINAWFLGALFGTALAAVAASIMSWASPGGGATVGGAVLYLLGTIGVTMARNVPLNEALARIGPHEPGAATAWRDYVARWTWWNHVRTAAALAAAAAIIIGIAARPG